MKKITGVLHGIIALALGGMLIVFWYRMVVQGDAPWSSWSRSFDVFNLYVDLYVLAFITLFVLPTTIFCGVNAIARLRGKTLHAGWRWSGTLMAGLCIGFLLIVTVRYQVWTLLMETSAQTGPTLPGEDRLEFPELPLKPEEAFSWELTDVNGNMINVADLKGKTLFVNIWATWCGWCILEFPSIEKLYADFRDNEDIVFLFVTLEDAETVIAWTATDGAEFDLPFYRSEVDFPSRFSPRGYPTTFIVAPDGRMAFQHSGAATWDGEKTRDFLTRLSEGAAAQP